MVIFIVWYVVFVMVIIFIVWYVVFVMVIFIVWYVVLVIRIFIVWCVVFFIFIVWYVVFVIDIIIFIVGCVVFGIVIIIFIVFLPYESLVGNLCCLTGVRPQRPKISISHSNQCVQHCCVSKHQIWLPVLGTVNVHSESDVDVCSFACSLYKAL